MKIRLSFGNTNIKIGSDGRLQAHKNKKNPDERAYFEINTDFLSLMSHMFVPNMPDFGSFMNYPKSGGQAGSAQANKYLGEAAGHMLATGHDIFNYIAKFGAANSQIQFVLRLDGRLDRQKLLQAVRLAIVEEPILGSRLVENEPPFWKRLDDIDNVEFCSFEDTQDPDSAVIRYLETPLDMDSDPMFKLRLISSGPYDTLCFKVNHICSDGTGAKEAVELVSKIYDAIDSNNIYVPKPGIRNRSDQDRLFSALGLKNLDAAWNPLQETPRTFWPIPWVKGDSNATRVAISRLPHGAIEHITKFAKSKGATVNDYVLTAYFRAMFEMCQAPAGIPMDIGMTIDLRRYLPDQKCSAIRCFSGGVVTRLARVAGESFEKTMHRVTPMMNAVKNNYPGLQSAIGLERVEKAKFFETLDFYKAMKETDECADKCSPILSNLNYLSKTLFRFGKCNAVDAYYMPPAIKAPGLLLCVGTYNDVVTLTFSYYEAQFSRKDIERLLYLIKKELMEGWR